jgi:hypothetical protein
MTLDVDAILTGPNRYLYMECGATLYLTVNITNKFVTIGPDTYKKGADSQGNPVPVLNSPDEGDTAVRLSFNPLLLRYEWTTDITHQLDFKPSFEAWHPSYYCPGIGAPSFLTNPDILWSAVGAHNVDINDAWPTSARVMQNYGVYNPDSMPRLSDYALRVRVTDNTDGFTDVAEKRMRVHFPIEGWQRHWTILHPLPERPSYPDNYEPDWTCAGMQSTEVPTGVERTFTVSESRTISDIGTIGTEAGLQVGTDEAKVAFKTYENIETGVSYNVSCSATLKYTMYPGFLYYEFWAYQWEEKAGVCQIYGTNGYQGETRWWAAKYLRLPGNFLSIRLYVRVVPKPAEP